MNSATRTQLEAVLTGDKAQRDLFLVVLQRLHCAENLLFYMDVMHYKSLQNASDRQTYAYIMWDKFFNEESLNQINVDAETLQTVRENVAAAAPTLFDGALAEIMTMLEFDSFPKFLKSDQYKQYQIENATFLGSEKSSDSISNPFQGQTSSPKLLRASRATKKAPTTSSPLKLLNGDQLTRASSSPASAGKKKSNVISKLFASNTGDSDAVTKQSPSKKRSREILESARTFLEDSSPAKRMKRATKLLDFFGVPAQSATEALDELTPRSAAAAAASTPKALSAPYINNENMENAGIGSVARRGAFTDATATSTEQW